MVVFTCNHCGDSLQKPKVEKHYFTVCRKPFMLTCVDCLKDFKNDYAQHMKCMTEEQRYSAKGSVSFDMKKGEAKQQSWMAIVNRVLELQKDLTGPEYKLLEAVSKNENCPKKKNKFMNFVKSAFGNKIKEASVEKVWNLLEAEKNAAAAIPKPSGDKEPEKSAEPSNTEKAVENNEVSTETGAKKKQKKTKCETSEEQYLKAISNESNNERSASAKKQKTVVDLSFEEWLALQNKESLLNECKNGKKKESTKQNGVSLSEEVSGNKKKGKLKENVVNGCNGTTAENTNDECNTTENGITPGKKKRKMKTSEETNGDISKKKKTDLESSDNVEEEKSKQDENWNKFFLDYEKIVKKTLQKHENQMNIDELIRDIMKQYEDVYGVQNNTRKTKRIRKKILKCEFLSVDNETVVLKC